MSSHGDETVPGIGRRLWIHPTGPGDLDAEAFNSAFEEKEREFQPGAGGPIGFGVIVEDRDLMERRPEAVWPETGLTFAGYLPERRQLRVRYFRGATVSPGASPGIDQLATRGYALEDRLRIEPLAESGSVTADDVLDLWAREGVVAEAAARRRIDQVSLVAVADERDLAGISTIYLDRNARLGMELWHYRTFVASGHRRGSLAAQLLFHNVELLEGRFASGEDTRAQGMLTEVENEGLMRGLGVAVWPQSGFIFIGENPLGFHIRVRYFEGARVPLPQAH